MSIDDLTDEQYAAMVRALFVTGDPEMTIKEFREKYSATPHEDKRLDEFFRKDRSARPLARIGAPSVQET